MRAKFLLTVLNSENGSRELEPGESVPKRPGEGRKRLLLSLREEEGRERVLTLIKHCATVFLQVGAGAVRICAKRGLNRQIPKLD